MPSSVPAKDSSWGDALGWFLGILLFLGVVAIAGVALGFAMDSRKRLNALTGTSTDSSAGSLAPNSVNTSQIVNGAVTAGKLEESLRTQVELANAGVRSGALVLLEDQFLRSLVKLRGTIDPPFQTSNYLATVFGVPETDQDFVIRQPGYFELQENLTYLSGTFWSPAPSSYTFLPAAQTMSRFGDYPNLALCMALGIEWGTNNVRLSTWSTNFDGSLPSVPDATVLLPNAPVVSGLGRSLIAAEYASTTSVNTASYTAVVFGSDDLLTPALRDSQWVVKGVGLGVQPNSTPLELKLATETDLTTTGGVTEAAQLKFCETATTNMLVLRTVDASTGNCGYVVSDLDQSNIAFRSVVQPVAPPAGFGGALSTMSRVDVAPHPANPDEGLLMIADETSLSFEKWVFTKSTPSAKPVIAATALAALKLPPPVNTDPEFNSPNIIGAFLGALTVPAGELPLYVAWADSSSSARFVVVRYMLGTGPTDNWTRDVALLNLNTLPEILGASLLMSEIADPWHPASATRALSLFSPESGRTRIVSGDASRSYTSRSTLGLVGGGDRVVPLVDGRSVIANGESMVEVQDTPLSFVAVGQ